MLKRSSSTDLILQFISQPIEINTNDETSQTIIKIAKQFANKDDLKTPIAGIIDYDKRKATDAKAKYRFATHCLIKIIKTLYTSNELDLHNSVLILKVFDVFITQAKKILKKLFGEVATEDEATKASASVTEKAVAAKDKFMTSHHVNKVGKLLPLLLSKLHNILNPDAKPLDKGKIDKKNIIKIIDTISAAINKQIESKQAILTELDEIELSFIAISFKHLMTKGTFEDNPTITKINILQKLVGQLFATNPNNEHIEQLITMCNACIDASRDSGTGERAITLEQCAQNFREQLVQYLLRNYTQLKITAIQWNTLLILISRPTDVCQSAHLVIPFCMAEVTEEKTENAPEQRWELANLQLELIQNIFSLTKANLRQTSLPEHLKPYSQQINTILVQLIEYINTEEYLNLHNYINIKENANTIVTEKNMSYSEKIAGQTTAYAMIYNYTLYLINKGGYKNCQVSVFVGNPNIRQYFINLATFLTHPWANIIIADVLGKHFDLYAAEPFQQPVKYGKSIFSPCDICFPLQTLVDISNELHPNSKINEYEHATPENRYEPETITLKTLKM